MEISAGSLTLTFIILKICGVIYWSWWWVFCPIWIPFAVFLAIVLWPVTLFILFIGIIKLMGIAVTS